MEYTLKKPYSAANDLRFCGAEANFLCMGGTAHKTGIWGERAAARYLRKKGYRILGRRVRLGPRDELDIVARRDRILVFAEVKTRSSEAYGRPGDAVDRGKRAAQSRAAVHYLKRCGFPAVYFRFDVIEVVGEPGSRNPLIRHHENAFTLDSRYSLPM